MKLSKLGDICYILNGYAFKSSKYNNKGYRVIRITNVQKGVIVDEAPQYYSDEDMEDLKKYELFENDILMSLTGNVGRVGIMDKSFLPAALNQRVACLRLKSKDIYYKYLFYYLNSDRFEHLCIENSNGIAQKNLSTVFLKDVLIPIPPLETQKKIVGILDKAQGLIDARKEQIRLMDELIQSVFYEMFGDPVTNPKGWKKCRLENYIFFMTSGSRGWSNYFQSTGEMFLTIRNVKNNKIMLENIQYIKAPKTKEAERTKVKEGDLLISITADLGRTGVVNEEIASYGAYINQHLSLVRLNDDIINPVYVSYFLESKAGKIQFEGKNQNGVKAGLNFNAIKSLELLVPPRNIQKDFVDCINIINESKYEMKKSLDEIERNYNALMVNYF